MNTKNVVIICVALLIIAIFFWPTLYRYDTTTIGENTFPVRTFRLTGNSEYFMMGTWYGGEKVYKSKIIPAKERNKIKVIEEIIVNKVIEEPIATSSNSDLVLMPADYGKFEVKIYNGSNWTITTFVVLFKIKNGDSLKLASNVKIPPLSMGDVFIEVSEGYNDYKIDEIKGYEE